jgi:hypothetical protein
MTVNVSTFGDNPFQPGMWSDAYVPDQLIAGNLKIVTGNGLITGAAALKRGTVLGQVTVGAATTAVKASGANTGNGTVAMDGTTPVLANAKPGLYQVRFTTATAYTVTDPSGAVIGNGANGAAFADRVKFTTTAGGTPFVAGDGFDITLAAGSGSYKLATAGALDGSSAPVAVLVDDVDATGGDVMGGVYLMAEVNGNALIFDNSLTLAGISAAFRPLSLFVKTPVSAADPT